jgi:hypothetical protein
VPRDVVALVSADDFVSAVRVYADRVNDLLLRAALPLLESIGAAETDALDLLDELVEAPAEVLDLAGWWFARAVERAGQGPAAASPEAAEAIIRLLATSPAEVQVRTALGGLASAERTAVVLRDGYDLPPQAVQVALQVDADTATELTAAGRLGLVATYDARSLPSLDGHAGRTTVDLASLSKLAEGSLEAPRAAALRRHATSCEACSDVLEALSRSRRLAAGLPIIAMDGGARESLIARVAAQAEATLPSHEAVVRALDEDDAPGPPISPVIAVIVLVIAVALGVIIAAVSSSGHSPKPAPAPVPFITPTGSPGQSALPGTSTSQPPSPSGGTSGSSGSSSPSQRPSGSTSPSHSASQTPTSPPPASGPAIVVAPDQGAKGSTIEVSGSGWTPGSTVRVTYGHTGTTVPATVDSGGQFTATLRATAVLPGVEQITAVAGSKRASTSYTQTV